jgi:hypothetical protein
MLPAGTPPKTSGVTAAEGVEAAVEAAVEVMVPLAACAVLLLAAVVEDPLPSKQPANVAVSTNPSINRIAIAYVPCKSSLPLTATLETSGTNED